MAFGKYPDVSLAEARKRHANARAELAGGVDPMAVRKEVKEKKRVELAEAEAAVEQPRGLTFRDLTDKFFTWWGVEKNKKQAKNVKTRLETDILAQLGAKLPHEITRMEVVALTKAVADRGARDIAKRNLQFIRRIFTYGMDNGYLDQNTLNPATDIKPDSILSKVKVKHFASLPIERMPELLPKMDDYRGAAITRIAMELMCLTFLRTSTLIGGLWSEIDWADQCWRIPKERMKKGESPHIVPLATQTLALLERLHGITGPTGRLFPQDQGGPGVMSNNTILKALDRMGYKGLMTGHGYRSVASTYLNEKGFKKDHIELHLSHMEQDEVRGAYNYARYLEARAVMMQFWADALDQLREKGKNRIHRVE
jgi:integrase